jgi:hypothetical protein
MAGQPVCCHDRAIAPTPSNSSKIARSRIQKPLRGNSSNSCCSSISTSASSPVSARSTAPFSTPAEACWNTSPAATARLTANGLKLTRPDLESSYSIPAPSRPNGDHRQRRRLRQAAARPGAGRGPRDLSRRRLHRRPALRVDRYCRLHPPETRATLSAKFLGQNASCSELDQ